MIYDKLIINKTKLCNIQTSNLLSSNLQVLHMIWVCTHCLQHGPPPCWAFKPRVYCEQHSTSFKFAPFWLKQVRDASPSLSFSQHKENVCVFQACSNFENCNLLLHYYLCVTCLQSLLSNKSSPGIISKNITISYGHIPLGML